MENFYHFIASVFPVLYIEPSENGAQVFMLDLHGCCLSLILFMDAVHAMRMEASLREIWDSLHKWDDMAFSVLHTQYEGDANEELDLRVLEIYEDASFSLGYGVLDDPDNLHLFVPFKRQGKTYIPGTELQMQTY